MKTHSLFYLLIIITIGLFSSCKEDSKIVVEDAIALKAIPFPLSDTRLPEGSPFKHAMDKNAEWLLELEPDRFLHRFRLHAGLEPKADIYSGWESLGVSGHTLGHYLSACAMMYAASGDERFKDRVDYIVQELAECQQARGTGYVGGIPDEDKIWEEVSKGDIRSDGFDLNGGWVPWYTQHKIWAGLIDAYLYAGNKQAKEVVVKLSDWAVGMFGHLTKEQYQQMLACEFGGMNESFAEMYAITGNEAYLKMAENFYHKAILDPLKEKRDELEGKHSNTQVPKIVGAARMYELTGDPVYHTLSTFYWDRMVNYHTYLNGGNSDYEHLGHPGCLNDRLSDFTSETCNTYNMLKLTKHLFGWMPEGEIMDYYERALYNHILASQNPEDGMVCYSVALASGTEKIFSTPFESFWCCVASGIENHVKYAESVFFKSADDGLYINLFIPTELKWKEKGLTVRLETQFPEENKVRIRFDGPEKFFPLYVRYPQWATDGMKATIIKEEVTGIGIPGFYSRMKATVTKEKVTIKGTPGSYFTVEGTWGKGAILELEIPMTIRTESMPDNPDRVGIFYGPLLMAAELGKETPQVYEIPVLISGRTTEKELLTRRDGLHFSSGNATFPSNVDFIPFYKIYGQKHAVYFDRFTEETWREKEKAYIQMQENQKAIDARTLDVLRIGEMQPERDHNLTSENSWPGEAQGHKFRHAIDGWFAFDMQVDPFHPVQMVCSYWGADKEKRNFDIFVDGQLFREESLQGEHGNRVIDVVYDIPFSLTQGKEFIHVKFQSRPGNFAGGLFGFRILKK